MTTAQRRIGESTIRKYIKLAEAPVELKERIERDEIPLGAAFELFRHYDGFISEVVTTPKLTKEIVRQRAKSIITTSIPYLTKGIVERHL